MTAVEFEVVYSVVICSWSWAWFFMWLCFFYLCFIIVSV